MIKQVTYDDDPNNYVHDQGSQLTNLSSRTNILEQTYVSLTEANNFLTIALT
jgi:hypothetical protein